MKRVKWCIETGFAGATHRGEWEVDDDTTEADLEEMLQDEIANHVSASYWPADEA